MNILIGILLLLGGSHLYATDLKQEVMERINYRREHPNDHSYFHLSASSDEQPPSDRHTKVHFIVTDSQGRKTGFESLFTFPEGDSGVNSLREIPNTAYGIDQTGSINPDDPPGPESATLNFFPPVLKDTYTVQFIGFEDCSYSVGMYLRGVTGEDIGESITYKTYIRRSLVFNATLAAERPLLASSSPSTFLDVHLSDPAPSGFLTPSLC